MRRFSSRLWWLSSDPSGLSCIEFGWLHSERQPPGAIPQLAPDLVAEIGSPSQYDPAIAIRAKRQLERGVRLIWIIWPIQRQIDVWRAHSNTPEATLQAGDLLDGLEEFTDPLAELSVE